MAEAWRKDTTETKDAVCSLDGEKVSIIHRRIEVPRRKSDPSMLRVDCWDCSRAKSCKNEDCLGRVRNGMVKSWVEEK